MNESPVPSFADRIVIDGNEPKSTPRNLKDVADGTVLVGQLRQVFQNETKDSMIVDIELLSVEWVFQFSVENDSKGERTKQMETEVGMTVTSGREVADSVSASAGFSGFGFTAEVNASTQTKTFTSLETSKKMRVTDTYNVPPESSIFVYKRQYKFRCRSWLYCAQHDAWVEVDGKKVQAYFAHEIIANQELISPAELTNHGRITNTPPSGLVRPTRGHKMSPREQLWYIMGLKMVYPWIP
ncbi:hypothetical protein FIE12Z_12011 [Fusarium flagelliforme]|uniref:Uncharacterized protein n=1 Tax=Fusarium flagelliforme TaxID=2675880 RepID=A0A395M7C6_9HYPO|nr:hypothetical protein FIE12Z_12011 [Fusarium flagelliforme]